MKVYFATHSTTTDNEAEICSGWKDVELSQLGIKQTQRDVGDVFKKIPIDLVCCSDLKRAAQTVEIAFGDRLPVIKDQRLREINYGDFNGRPAKIVDPMKKKRIDKPFPNGESYKEAVSRVEDFYCELKKKYPNKTVLVVGHRATYYGLETLIHNKTIKECLGKPFRWQPYWEYEL